MTTLSARQMLDLIERHMQLEVDGDVDGVMATLTDDVTWGTEATGQYVGAAAVRAHYMASITPPGRFTTESFRGWADEDRQEAVGLWTVRRPGVDATYPVLALFRFADSLIRSEELFHDASSPSCGASA
jgi:ketosteroid isomerase-like protein